MNYESSRVGHSYRNVGNDRPVEVTYDHHFGLPQHVLSDSTTVRSAHGLAHQPTKQVPSAPLTCSLNDARRGSADSFAASTVTSTAPGAVWSAVPSALTRMVDEAVVTMDHAVRVPSALRSAGRRTMFDVLVDVAAKQRRREQWKTKLHESTEEKNTAGEPSATSRDAQMQAPHPFSTAASSLDAASSAREMTYQVLFPRAAAAATATRLSSSTTTASVPGVESVRVLGNAHSVAAAPSSEAAEMTSLSKATTAAAVAVVPPSPSRTKHIFMSASPLSNPPPSPSSPLPLERAKPDRRLRHLLPAHLRGSPTAWQRTDDNSQGHTLQTVRKDGTDRPQARHADYRTGVAVLDASDISSISSCSDDDTARPNARHPQPHRGARRSATGSSAAAPTLHPQAPPAATRPTVFSRLIDGDTEELARLSSRHEGGGPRRPERPPGVTEAPEKKWALLEQALMGTAGAVASSPRATGPKCFSDRCHRRRSGHHRIGRTTTSGSSERSTTHSRTTDASASDLDSTSSGVENCGQGGGGVADLRNDLDDEVPQWVRQHEAARERLAQQQQQQQRRFSWASPTFSKAHMSFIERAAAADKARAQAAATAAAPQALVGKPRYFCPSSMAPRTPSAASYAAGGLAGWGTSWSAASDAVRGRQHTRSALTAAAAVAGAPQSLLAAWKDGKRLLKQRSTNATAVAVLEYLCQRFQAWKPCGLRLLRSGICFSEAAAPPMGSPLSCDEHERDPGRLLVNPAWDDAVRNTDGPIEDISGTSSDDGGRHTSAVTRKTARKPRRFSTVALPSGLPPQGRSGSPIGGVTDSPHEASAQSRDQGKASESAAAELGSGGDEGVELQMKVHYMESAFNIVAVHGELTYASESACARLGLVYPLLSSSPRLSSGVSGREDAATTPTAQQRRWTFLVPEPALMHVPVLLQEHLYLAPPYTVFREMQTVLSGYNFTTDTLLRQHVAEEEAAQEERQRRRALDIANVASMAAPTRNAATRAAAVADRTAVGTGSAWHMFDNGYEESGDRQRGARPTRSASRCNDAASSVPPRWWAALEENSGTPVHKAAPTHARTPTYPAGAPVASYSPTSMHHELGGPPLESPQRPQRPVADEEDARLRTHAADGVETHTSATVRQCGSGCVGASPEPRQPAPHCPPSLPPLRDAGYGCDPANTETRWRQGIPPGQPSLSPSCVRPSTASVNSIAVDGFYDPLTMPALPTTGAERGIMPSWGANERWGNSGGGDGDTRGTASTTTDVTMVLTRESEYGAERGIVPVVGLEHGLAEGPRELPIPPQMIVRPSSSFSSPRAVEASAAVSGGALGDDTRARGGNALASGVATVTTAAIAVTPRMDKRIGDGFPRGPTADWDIPVEVLFALSGGFHQWRKRSERPLQHTQQHCDADADSISENDDKDGACMAQRSPTGVRNMATTSARFTQEPVHARKRHRPGTQTSDDAFTITMLGKTCRELDSATASQLALQNIPRSTTFSFPTPHSQSSPAASSVASSTAPSSSSLSSFSEPEDGHDDGVKDGSTAYATCAPRWKVRARGVVRRTRHGARCSRLDEVLATRQQQQQQQQQQQERWMRELWGSGKQHDAPSVLLSASSTTSARTSAPAGLSQCSAHQRPTSQSQRRSMAGPSKPLSSVVDASVSAPSVGRVPARTMPITRGTGGNGSTSSAQLASPLPDDDSAVMVPHISASTSLSALEASTATAGVFALEDVYLSDSV
ncbi:conserved hypothetical protein [Leishmania braziliensis MHOM/BR/75/M2904]|uniref:Uncharacterized protein n=2 Tax=Leishmania braziliensis TaxID=5660 RepID=A4HA63_LEIBR|nr:conserved hypothetical protein [Leishmania braziliensis MHOM/BR/75/M2904]CAJ2470764.1 unnamed protein product [Leishmania braziliensis]CAM38291.2 conserved hypothetical protein [Leishmania braziliensis MHOM/BR/75/M2904]SYZ64925.1 hypothetical_protein [Leishmania braziliensis MHOM/BR/75/M2904]